MMSSVRLDPESPQLLGQAIGPEPFGLGPEPFGLGSQPFGLGSQPFGLPLLEELEIRGERNSPGIDDLQVVGAFTGLEPDLESRAHEARHLGDLLEDLVRSKPAVEISAFGVVDVVLLDPVSLVEEKLAD